MDQKKLNLVDFLFLICKHMFKGIDKNKIQMLYWVQNKTKGIKFIKCILVVNVNNYFVLAMTSLTKRINNFEYYSQYFGH